MSDQKDYLAVFGISERELDDFLGLTAITISFNYDWYMSIESDHKQAFDRAKNMLGKEKVDLIMMYLAFSLSLGLRRGEPTKDHWKKIRRLEITFLRFADTAERLPSEVETMAFVIRHYWAYLSEI